MTLPDLLLLTLLMALLALLPSTSVALVVARSATLGFGNGVATTLGIVSGDLVFVVLAILGMTALAEWLGTLFFLVKLLAGGYLIWFGISLLRQQPDSGATVQQPARGGWAASYGVGLLVTLGDVKAILFYASLFPAFVDLAALTATDIGLIMLVTTLAVGGVKLLYAWMALRLVALNAGRKVRQLIRRTSGVFMMGVGGYLILKS